MEHTGFHNKEHYSPECPKCRQKTRDTIIGLHLSHCYQGEYENNCKYGDENCPACNKLASLTPPWLIEYEKEQGDKLAILKKLVKIKRDGTFAESAFGSREHQREILAMVNAYDVVLRLIDKAIGGKEWELTT